MPQNQNALTPPPASTATDERGYPYADAAFNPSHGYLLGPLHQLLEQVQWPAGPRRVFELGCGNGSVASSMAKKGYDVTGIDPSSEGIAQANRAFPDLKLYQGSAYDDLAAKYGTFPALVSLEVVEHVYFPRKFAACVYNLVQPGGTAIISTPYHSYLKNLVLAATGAMDKHFTVLWEHGHIKFWSRETLSRLLMEAGFKSVEYRRVGRVPILAKSMIAIAKK